MGFIKKEPTTIAIAKQYYLYKNQPSGVYGTAVKTKPVNMDMQSNLEDVA